MKESTRMFYFVIYTFAFQSLIWGSLLYLIMVHGWSEWTLLAAVFIASMQFQPRHFGIAVKEKNPCDLNDDDFEKYEKAKNLEIKLAKAKNDISS